MPPVRVPSWLLHWALLFSAQGLLQPSSLAAQTGTAELHVIVEDSSQTTVRPASLLLVCSGNPPLHADAESENEIVFPNLPFGPCRLTVASDKFEPATLETTLATASSTLKVRLLPAKSRTEVLVSASASGQPDWVATAQATLNNEQIARIPVSSSATAFTDILTRTTPGVAADSNGFAHPLGEHADTSISLDGQPITDQQAKVFANQLDPNLIQSLDAITGAPPVEFGGKTSLVIAVTSKSGLGQRPSGFLSSSYGSFASLTQSLAFSLGGEHWGNFFTATIGSSARFLDTPEFQPIHDRGNNSSVFDRLDWRPHDRDLLHLNLSLGRSWFQTPDSYESASLHQDQRSQIRNANAAIGWQHVFGPDLLATFTPFYRHDESQYFPSSNPFADTPATLAQNRTLTNTGFRLEGQYVRGIHSWKAGVTDWHTLLGERFSVGLTDPVYNAVCLDDSGAPVAAIAIHVPQDCAKSGLQSNPDFLPRILPYDLTRGGQVYRFNEGATIHESAFYLSDAVTLGQLHLNLGLRYDRYNGLSRGKELQPRLGIAWRAAQTGTLLRASYARLFETPYNENLIFASQTGDATGIANPFADYRSEPVRPGTRNQFNAGLEQRLGKHLQVDADYYWKFTRNAFDFDTLFNTPITFSVAWKKSKIDGLALRVNLADFHGLTAYSVMGHVRSRFFPPEVGGLVFNNAPDGGVFRIDHGEEFEHTTNLRYQTPAGLLGRFRPWVSGVWRFNSGLALPDTVPAYTDALQLTADQQWQMGLQCGAEFATPAHPIRSCAASDFRSTRIRIPAPGTHNDDTNPVRVSQRNLFDLSAGEDQLLKVERLSLGIQFAVLNLTNQVALYNFLSTFSGTHFVAPRSYQASLQVRF